MVWRGCWGTLDAELGESPTHSRHLVMEAKPRGCDPWASSFGTSVTTRRRLRLAVWTQGGCLTGPFAKLNPRSQEIVMVDRISDVFITRSRRTSNKKRSKRRFEIEGLEARQVMAANLTANLNTDDGVLRIEGTPNADQI